VANAITRRSLKWMLLVLPVALLAQAVQAAEFVDLPAGNDPFPGVVAIAIPPNCPSSAAVYGRALEAALKAKNIPVREVAVVQFSFHGKDDVQRIDTLMRTQPQPQVFISGRMTGHPSLDEVESEFNNRPIEL
jgi:hypothetical protein